MTKNYINSIYENYYYCYNLNYLDYNIKNNLYSQWLYKIFKFNKNNYFYRKRKNQISRLYTNLYIIQKCKANSTYRWSLNFEPIKSLSSTTSKSYKQIKVLSRLTRNKKRYVKYFQSFSLKGYNIITEKIIKPCHRKTNNYNDIVNRFNNNVLKQLKQENTCMSKLSDNEKIKL